MPDAARAPSHPRCRRALITADAVGGVWAYCLELAAALGKRGVEVILATMGPLPSPAQRRQVAALPGVTLEASDYKLEWMDDPWRDVEAAGEWLLSLERRYAPDVIHVNGLVHASLPWNAPALAVGHSCVLSWWRAVKGADAPPEWDRYRAEAARGLQAAGIVVAPTPWMLAQLRRLYGPFKAGAVVPNGRGATLFRPRAKKPFLLSAGRLWDDAKNLSLLREATTAGLPWPARVAGDCRHPSGGPDANPGQLQVLGPLSPAALAAEMGAASIYVLPALYEPFGLSALEAALCRCALVLGDIPSLREVWGDAALYADPRDPGALAHALRSLIADEPRRLRLASLARARAAAYAPAAMADHYLRLYHSLLHPASQLPEPTRLAARHATTLPQPTEGRTPACAS